MTTKEEALVQERYYPAFIRLEGAVADTVPTMVLAREYARWLNEAGLGPIVGYSVEGMDAGILSGSQTDLEQEITQRGGNEVGYFALVTKDQTHLSAARGLARRPTWTIQGCYPAGLIPVASWMTAMETLCIEAAKAPGFQFVQLARHETSWAEFPPMPPIAGYKHVVTTTEQEVADAYEDPASFFRSWDRVVRVGDHLVCIRAIDKLEVEDWLAATFEFTMHLARVAKPGRTIYRTPGDVRKAFAPWWEYGDIITDERAGYPALSFVGYDPTTLTIEYAGYCTNTDIAKGGTDPRHVLIREIHEIRALVKAKKDGDGRPVDAVRVVFAEEWMARSERRPLLDVGAHVFFLNRKTGELVEVSD